MKERLLKLLSRFEFHYNEILKKKVVVEFFSGIKPTYYYTPDVFGSLSKPPFSESKSWFVEIWVNGLCIWRRSATNDDSMNLESYEDELVEQMVDEILMFGLANSYEFEKKRKVNE